MIAWQLACNLNDSQPQLRDALDADDQTAARILAEVICRARMQDAISNALCPDSPVDHDAAIANEITALGFSEAVKSRAYALTVSIAGGREHSVVALDATTAWFAP